MTQRNYYELSAAEAFAYRDLVRARHVPKLALLARLMQDSGGPIEQMDASPASMVPLWEWTKRFADAGFPGLPPEVTTALSELLWYESQPSEQSLFLGELIEHYVFEVVKRAHPDATWEVYVQRPSKIPSEEHHATGVKLSNGRIGVMRRRYGAAIVLHLERNPRVEAADSLLKGVELFFEVPAGSAGAGSSVLVPLLEVSSGGDWDRVVVEDAAAGAAVAGVSGTVEDHPEDSELVFAIVGSDPEELESARPLDGKAVAEVLARHGFVDEEGRAVKAPSFTEDISEFESAEVGVLVSVLVTRKKVRALFLEIGVGDAAVKAFLADLDRLGERIGARLGPTDLMEDPE